MLRSLSLTDERSVEPPAAQPSVPTHLRRVDQVPVPADGPAAAPKHPRPVDYLTTPRLRYAAIDEVPQSPRTRDAWIIASSAP
jgi:hypothetical protein